MDDPKCEKRSLLLCFTIFPMRSAGELLYFIPERPAILALIHAPSGPPRMF